MKQTSTASSNLLARRDVYLAAELFVMTLLVFLPALKCGFINFDDPQTVSDSPQIARGLSMETVKWAFTHTEVGSWVPLTTISHMIDCQIYGLSPWGHHLTNVLLHASATSLLFIVLKQMTGATWRSVLVAALFAVHPLRVESVVWVTERKDVLSGVFFMLALLAYVHYVRQRSFARYLWIMPYFVLGLLSKAMLVTLPFLLLLLDYWPLNRLSRSAGVVNLIIEKFPLLAVSIVAAVAQILAVRGTTSPTSPLSLRLANAAMEYLNYLGKLAWPTKLAVFYPYPSSIPMIQAVISSLALLMISVVVIRVYKSHPYLLVGWLWFLGTLVPVIGLVQAGDQATADRYTYIPSVGLFLLLIWSCCDLTIHWRYHTKILSAAACVVLVCSVVLTHKQIAYWMNSETLFRHAIAVTKNNWKSYDHLGNALVDDPARLPEAIAHYEEALRIKPDYAEANVNLGVALSKIPERAPEAIAQYEAALEINPNLPDAHYNLGIALAASPGQLADAITHYEAALRLKPEFAEAHHQLGMALSMVPGRYFDAIANYEAALALKPDLAATQNNLGFLLTHVPGRLPSAIDHLRTALRIEPNFAEAHYNLAIALIKNSNDHQEAVVHLQLALRIKPDFKQAREMLNHLQAIE